jgi:hydrogenase maturation protein HypF
VGFRPFVYSLARDIGLVGSVYNSSDGVKIEIQGTPEQQIEFEKRLTAEAPPLSQITSLNAVDIDAAGDTEFTIVSSQGEASVSTLISTDVALCEDCRIELFDPQNRRYRYPFINCTNCGPRYTIIENVPYDRPFTSMKHFPLCPDCEAEYKDPSDRRFHAQPNACPVCGPKIWMEDQKGEHLACDDPILETISYLKQGKIVAIKGLGGFHLAVDPTNNEAVARLRKAKGRDEKPFALMVRDVGRAEELVVLSPKERESVASIQAPIVLARSRMNTGLADNLAPGNDRLGIMLPYTPLHHLLLAGEMSVLVMTSANFSEEPICIDNLEAKERLEALADVYLLHDRDIYLRSDDSVVMEMSGKIRPVRRSRGFAPRPIFLSKKSGSVLAVGAELKNVVALSKDEKVFLSQHIGDLENLEAFEFFKMTIEHIKRIFEIEPELLVHDLHPEYLSTKWAKDQHIPLLGVQHHHAHMVSCMAENGLAKPVIGIIMDGTGYGTDGTIWGGEFLIGDARGYERVGHLEAMPLPGGSAAIKSPWRTGVAYLHHAFGADLPLTRLLPMGDAAPIIQMIEQKINTPLTSSCGRLFDAVAAISGGRQEIRYEAQAAIEFMQAAQGELGRDRSVFEAENRNEQRVIPISPILRELIDRMDGGRSLTQLSRWFHASLIQSFATVADELRHESSIGDVVLSGGVFQNVLLFEGLVKELQARGLRVYTHEQVPANDGGIALGQVAIGQAVLSL